MHGKSVRTICPVYAGMQKQQKSNFIKIPAGTFGTIRVCELDTEYNIEMFLVRFVIEDNNFFSKMAHSMFEIVNEIDMK